MQGRSPDQACGELGLGAGANASAHAVFERLYGQLTRQHRTGTAQRDCKPTLRPCMGAQSRLKVAPHATTAYEVTRMLWFEGFEARR